jgi:hypothetical protein
MTRRQNKSRRNGGVCVPLFMSIIGINERIELSFNAVLLNAVVMQKYPIVIINLNG